MRSKTWVVLVFDAANRHRINTAFNVLRHIYRPCHQCNGSVWATCSAGAVCIIFWSIVRKCYVLPSLSSNQQFSFSLAKYITMESSKRLKGTLEAAYLIVINVIVRKKGRLTKKCWKVFDNKQSSLVCSSTKWERQQSTILLEDFPVCRFQKVE